MSATVVGSKKVRQRRMPLSTSKMVTLTEGEFYGDTIRTLTEAHVPFVVGGAFALKHYAGIDRATKDLDVFLQREHLPRALDALRAKGYLTEDTFPHWLAKAWCGPSFVDFIHASANGLCRVDPSWIASAKEITIFGEPALLCPVEDVIWSKCFVMERERFDGADIYHLLAAKGDTLDWGRLLANLGEHWRVLLGHLVFYSFVYPRDREKIPRWVVDGLMQRMADESASENVPVCNGTLLSREQYLFDLREKGYVDARVHPHGNVPAEDIELWTDAIGKIK